MFLPTRNGAVAADRPADSLIAPADWDILAALWHPVAFEADVGSEPLPVTLLDVPLVVWRGPAGVAAARDLCPHRGARLSMGEVRDGLLVCPLHGFHYGEDGRCRKVPALPAAASIPKRLCLKSCAVVSRYGLVWVCLAGEARLPLPEWPEVALPGAAVVSPPAGVWRAAAPRHVENFNDLCHIPFVHRRSFGGDEDVAVEPRDIEVTEGVLRFKADYFEQPRASEAPAADPASRRHRRYSYRLTLPFASALTIEDAESGGTFHVFDVASPVSAHVSRIFQILVDPSATRTPAAMIDFQQRINAEDAPLVEAQHPLDLPLDVMADVHIPADRMSIEYRRALARLGLGAAPPAGDR